MQPKKKKGKLQKLRRLKIKKKRSVPNKNKGGSSEESGKYLLPQ